MEIPQMQIESVPPADGSLQEVNSLIPWDNPEHVARCMPQATWELLAADVGIADEDSPILTCIMNAARLLGIASSSPHIFGPIEKISIC
jgi:hypothetical protein